MGGHGRMPVIFGGLGKLRQKGHHKFEITPQNGGHEIIKFGFHSCSLPSTYLNLILS